jgi:hypothetical protein
VVWQGYEQGYGYTTPGMLVLLVVLVVELEAKLCSGTDFSGGFGTCVVSS